jgi:glutamate N-acetyltransferase/amino-acid N-acetyltransferase
VKDGRTVHGARRKGDEVTSDNDTKDYRVPGFLGSAVAAGLKKDKGLDMALIYSEREATAAGVFTTNKVRAAPVLLTEENLKSGKARAIVVNAGNANACTGETGLQDARRTAELAASRLSLPWQTVLVASTGVIGRPLDMARIEGAMPDLVGGLSGEGLPSVSKAMMTTDSFPKMSLFKGLAGKTPYRILGVAKGAGMIMPNMATMLCFVLSDIRISPERIRQCLLASVKTTFNRITVDGDTSTNDTVVVLANGRADNSDLSHEETDGFRSGLEQVMGDLARMIVRDGEGATKLVRVEVKGAMSAADAATGARTVANSSLVKTACYGQDPNWGRIMAALGRSGIAMAEAAVDIWIDEVQIVSGGLGLGDEQERRAAERMTRKEFSIVVDLHQGSFGDQVFTCDLTHDYVSINANYRT